MTAIAPEAAEQREVSLEIMQIEVQKLQESLNTRIRDLDEANWTALLGWADSEEDGPGLDELQKLSPRLREMAGSNPWHIRGAQLRCAYVFGRGLKFVNVAQPRYKAVIEDPHNMAVMFSIQAYEAANLALFTDGNFFVIRNTKTNHFTQVPIRQVSAVSTDPDDSATIW